MNLDFLICAAETEAAKAKEAESRGNYALAGQKYRLSAAKYREAASQCPSRRNEFIALAEKYENVVFPARSGPAPTAGKNTAKTEAQSQKNKNDDVQDDMSSFYTFFRAEDLVDGFDKVIGLTEAKEAVTEYIINPIRYPEAYNYRFMSSKCILLEGPPGTGKTTFAKAVAKEIEQPFALVNVASLVNCYVGETGKTIDRVFDSLRAYVQKNDCGITVFFDEFDEIAKSRSGDDKASQTAVPALLRNLDGVKENKNFLIIANTNCREMLDAGILSRFRKRIYIPLPDFGMRVRFFRDKLAQLEDEYYSALDFERLAEASDGMSGRTITQICDDFLYFIGGVKAGIRSCSDYNNVMLDYIANAK